MNCPRAVPGPFYTLREDCLICEAPHEKAPSLMATHDDKAAGCSTHGFFKKQPETAPEVDEALDALGASCIEGLRYGGKDREIPLKPRARGPNRLRDHPIRGWEFWRR